MSLVQKREGITACCVYVTAPKISSELIGSKTEAFTLAS